MPKADPNQPIAFAFQGSGGQTSAITAGSVNPSGQVTKKFVKDLIRVGKFTGGGGAHQTFEVTADDHDPANGKFSLAHFMRQYDAMTLAGIDVTTPEGHSTDPSANRGYVRSMYIDGDTLHGIIEAIGQDAIDLVARNKVSINVRNSVLGGNGKTYDHPIDHVAIVPNPVIPNQQGFVAIAASRDQPDTGTALVLSPELTMATDDQTTTTDAPATDAPADEKPKVTDLASLATALGLQVGEGQDVGQAIMAAWASIRAKLTELEAKVKDADDKPAEGEVMVAASMNPTLAAMAVENAEMKLQGLVAAGNITPAVRDELKLALVGTAASPSVLTLSAGSKGQPSLLATFCGILAKNDPVKLKEQTKSQSAIVAARQEQTPDTSVMKTMIESANGTAAGQAL